jgi:hypothetical protein
MLNSRFYLLFLRTHRLLLNLVSFEDVGFESAFFITIRHQWRGWDSCPSWRACRKLLTVSYIDRRGDSYRCQIHPGLQRILKNPAARLIKKNTRLNHQDDEAVLVVSRQLGLGWWWWFTG